MKSTWKSTRTTTFRYATMVFVATTASVVAGCGASGSAAPQLPTATAAPTTMGDPSGSAPGATTPGVGSAVSTNSDAVSSDPDEAEAQFDRCMTDHGASVQIYDDSSTDSTSFTADGESKDDPNDEVAFEECKHYLEAAFGEFENNPQEVAENADQSLATAKCLKEAGYDNVTVDEKGTLNAELDPAQDPNEFDAAMRKCESAPPQP